MRCGHEYRITSYNVCYTKLLRQQALDIADYELQRLLALPMAWVSEERARLQSLEAALKQATTLLQEREQQRNNFV